MELDGRYRFDNYVVGSANRLAVTAARVAAEAPGSASNPLVLQGAAGTGKTHLLIAIGDRAAAQRLALRIDAVTIDEFVRQLHTAVALGATDAFRQRYAETRLLLIDDIQHLAGRRETQAELLRLCSGLEASGGQIVLTTDRPPSEIADVDRRLVKLLSSGLIVEIGAPDYETRVALLGSWCLERAVQMAPDAIEELGRASVASVRDLHAALNRAIAYGGARAPGARAEAIASDPPASDRGDSVRSTNGAAQSAHGAVSEYLTFLSDVAHVVARHVEPLQAESVADTDAPVEGLEPPMEGDAAPVAAAGVDPFFLDDEKVLWDWPEAPGGGRVIEDVR